MFGRALRIFRPEADRLAVALFLLLLSLGANLLKPWPVALLVDSVLGDRPLPAWLQALADPSDKARLVTLLALLLLGLHGAQSALMAAHHYLALQVGCNGLRRVRNDLFACLQRLSLRVHQSSRGKELTSRAAWDACAFQAWLQQGVIIPVSAALSLFLMVVVMWRLNTVLTLVALTVVPLLLLVLKKFGEKIANPERPTGR
jgi:ATP-binding cassette, subfamily B, bacterial